MNVDDDVETGSEDGADAPRPSEDWLAEQIWLITLGYNNGRKAKDWPRITYGSIPEGFVQQIPNVGTSPAQLIEGKIYVAQALDNALNGGACYFVIRNGKSVTVSPSEVLQEQR